MEFDIDLSEAAELISYSELDHIFSLDQLLARRNELQLLDGFNLEEIIDTRIASAAIRKALSLLSPKEKKVIILRYGLLDDRIRTLDEVGCIMHVTRERIRQIEAKALRKLKTAPHFRFLHLLYEEM